MSIGKRTRFDVFKRDGFACQYCGRTPPAVTLEVDHVHPQASGGTDDITNLLTSCFDCNSGKGARHLDSVPPQVAAQAEILKEKKEQLDQYNALLTETVNQRQQQIASIAKFYTDAGFPKQEVSRASIQRFLEKLPYPIVYESIIEAVDAFNTGWAREPFKYFCGICYRKIREAEGK